ncbi:MAG: hypothetical protein R3355_07310 [Pseudomonas sp.]|uniref:hypothetical protein n=1 Tax=Pseudomonas sp. TaxID=306 RepID=UPI00299E2055|nr:hypothetical protein [Pseudomonas sp.]MDX1722909.1 hypothetical protein [Pseudomonas sp.]
MDFKDYFDRQRYSASLPADLRPLEMKSRVKAMASALWVVWTWSLCQRPRFWSAC